MKIPIQLRLPAMIVGGTIALTNLLHSERLAAEGREEFSFDPGWRFNLGDIPFPEVKGHGTTYSYCKAGNAIGAAAIAYDDTTWRPVNLPHDWAVEGPFDKEANLSQGYRPRGIGWYRKRFSLPASDRGRHLELRFDGISTQATVWVNGTVAHRNFCGYTGFTIDLTPVARFGGEINTIAIRVDAVEQEGWWYEGAGIYRRTYLTKSDPVHIVTDGVYAQPVKDKDGTWTIPVEATLGNDRPDEVNASVESVLLDPSGAEIARAVAPVTVPALGESVARPLLTVQTPILWSLEKPTLYRVRTTVSINHQKNDSVTTTCGFRTLRFDPDQGFFLNDRPVKIKGTCNHQDHAGVGTVIPPSLWAYRVRRLKELGSNAYRCSHNPPARELLDECDRQGLLVMDEHRDFNISPEYQHQLEWLVRRDRNHPSVILWSVFNEESMQGTETGYEMVRRMSAVVKRLDKTRPVTAAMSGGHSNPINVSMAVDVVGFNYCQGGYDGFHAKHPQQPMTSSEDTSAFMTRGEWSNDKAKNIIGSQDDQRASWGATHRNGWKAIATRPFVAGGFVWTGFDYRGEPTPASWPSCGSFFGIMDLCGFPKTAYYIHQAQWIENQPVLKIQPHWNWSGKEGQEIPVMVMTNGDTVQLSLNGKDLGTQKVDRFEMNTWKVAYAPGKLEAVALKDGKEIARDQVETTGAPVALRLIPDRKTLQGDGQDCIPVTLEVVDAQGRVVPTASPMVHVTVDGSATNLGMGNGDNNCHEAEKSDQHSLFNGLGQFILQTKAGASGSVKLRASADGLTTGEVVVNVAAAPTQPEIAGVKPVMELVKWKMSPVSTTRPDPLQKVAGSDQNSWQSVQPGKLQPFNGGTMAVYRTEIKPFATEVASGGAISFPGITGNAEVWINDTLMASKNSAVKGPLLAPFPAGSKSLTVNVLLTVPMNGNPGGLDGPVTIVPQSINSPF